MQKAFRVPVNPRQKKSKKKRPETLSIIKTQSLICIIYWTGYSNQTLRTLLRSQGRESSRRPDRRPGSQIGPDILRALGLESLIPGAKGTRGKGLDGKEGLVGSRGDEVLHARFLLGTDDVDLVADLVAVLVEREIVVVFAEGVLDLAADGSNAEDDVGAHDGPRDGDPVEVAPELEG